MFDNIGGKIKGLAVIIFALGAVGSIIGGFVMMCSGIDELVITGLLTGLLGTLFSYISTMALYGFGQLIENTSYTANDMFKLKQDVSELKRNLVPQESNAPFTAPDGNVQPTPVYTNTASSEPTVDVLRPAVNVPETREERIQKLLKLYQQGYITNNEYQALMEKTYNEGE